MKYENGTEAEFKSEDIKTTSFLPFRDKSGQCYQLEVFQPDAVEITLYLGQSIAYAIHSPGLWISKENGKGYHESSASFGYEYKHRIKMSAFHLLDYLGK